MAVFVWLTLLIIILIVIVAYLQENNKKQEEIQNGTMPKKIPGLEPSHPEEGNISDIQEFRTMSLFLRKLHKHFGPIASFWEGRQYCVSVASPEYLIPQRHLFDLPDSINDTIRNLVGEDSLCLANGQEAMKRRQIYDRYFLSHDCQSFSETFLQIAHEYVNKWKYLESDDCIPITRHVLQASFKAITQSCLGNYFNDDQSLQQFQQKFDWIIAHSKDPFKPDSPEETTMRQYIKDIHETVRTILEEKLNETEKNEGKKLFIDVLLRDDIKECQRVSDAVTFLFTGYETVGRLIIWAIYECCIHPQVQEKIHQEIELVLKDEPINDSTQNKLEYLRQVINELLRMRSLAEYTGRKNDEQIKLGEYVIPKNTYIYHALAVMSNNDEFWPESEKFKPERFSREASQFPEPLLFKPFGFAGKRQCPGKTFATTEMTIFLTEWMRNFKFNLISEQTKGFNGVIPKIDEEIWVKLERRSK